MATPGELIKAVADVLHVPEVTISSYYRSLREAGFVTKGGRGRSAAKMTAADAAHLLIAVGGARFERETADSVVRDYLRLKMSHSARWLGQEEGWQENHEGVWTLPDSPVPQLTALPAHHCFGDALTALIEAVIAREEPFKRSHTIDVSFNGPIPAAGISLDFVNDDWSRDQEEGGYHLLDEPGAYDRDGALKINRTITWQAIHAIADLLREA